MHYLGVCQGYDVARESTRSLHATTRILLSRFTPRAVIWLAYSAHRRKADIPDMLTTVPHTWILDTVEPRVTSASRADREDNEFHIYEPTWFYISFLLPQGERSLRSLPDDGGVRGRS